MKKLDCVMLVDDDEVHNFINKKIVEHADIAHHIEIANNGKLALDYLNRNGSKHPIPNLILLDINMPVMNGWEFIEHYQQMNKKTKEKTVLAMLTTSTNYEDIARAKTLPLVSAFISKPLTVGVVKKLVQEYFATENQEEMGLKNEKEIINEIETLVQTNYTPWTIGITDSPEKKRKEHGQPKHWHHWRAETERQALNVKAHFREKGMKRSTVGQCFADYVYIFKME